MRVNFSIGTLDEPVWRISEPGTPPPRRRVEALARLTAAGIPCGVLVAPILPGLSDGEGQLSEVVQACIEAGAVSISSIGLHLRPGVRELFMPWLARVAPRSRGALREALQRPQRLPRARGAGALSARVRELVERHGGCASSPRDARSDAPFGPRRRPPPAPPAEPPAQLRLVG